MQYYDDNFEYPNTSVKFSIRHNIQVTVWEPKYGGIIHEPNHAVGKFSNVPVTTHALLSFPKLVERIVKICSEK
ncbi:hypothetical protein BWD42_12205 [Sphingobacterium sp. CZ-UAM]|nr:hypothetical protein BWD42_12205 [Sphingobacterium sp. CZ-UAM]